MTGRSKSGLVALLALGCILVAPRMVSWAPDTSDRDAISAPASQIHKLGTDALGRDRLARLVFGARISVLSATIAALATIALGLVLSLISSASRASMILAYIADALLSVPGFLLLVILRGSLPLSAQPVISLVATFSLLSLISWPQTARICLGALQSAEMRNRCSFARGCGLGVFHVQVWIIAPALFAVAAAQFAVLLPVFILAEADLGMLGLGAVEPMASLGGLLRELVTAAGDSGALVWVPLGATIMLALVFRYLTRRLVDVPS